MGGRGLRVTPVDRGMNLEECFQWLAAQVELWESEDQFSRPRARQHAVAAEKAPSNTGSAPSETSRGGGNGGNGPRRPQKNWGRQGGDMHKKCRPPSSLPPRSGPPQPKGKGVQGVAREAISDRMSAVCASVWVSTPTIGIVIVQCGKRIRPKRGGSGRGVGGVPLPGPGPDTPGPHPRDTPRCPCEVFGECAESGGSAQGPVCYCCQKLGFACGHWHLTCPEWQKRNPGRGRVQGQPNQPPQPVQGGAGGRPPPVQTAGVQVCWDCQQAGLDPNHPFWNCAVWMQRQKCPSRDCAPPELCGWGSQQFCPAAMKGSGPPGSGFRQGKPP